MKKLKFALSFLKFIPLPSLHAFMLAKAIEQVDPISVHGFLASSVVDRFSSADQSLILVSALKNLLTGNSKDPQIKQNARTICHMLLDRGVAFRGLHENNIVAHTAFLIAHNDEETALKLCHPQMSDNNKIDIFAGVVQHASNNQNEIVSIFYNLWSDVLKGSMEVSRLGWSRLPHKPRTSAPTLLEWCLARAPEHILLNLVNDCMHVSAQECVTLMRREYVSVELLEALVAKGLDLQRLLEIVECFTPHALECVRMYQQRKSIEQAVDSNTHIRATKQRKM